MSMLFGRPCSDTFYVDALNELEKSGNPTQRAFALNLRHDDRVSANRQREFDRIVKEIVALNAKKGHSRRPSEELLQAAVDYQWERVRTSPNPDFADSLLNKENIELAGKLLEEEKKIMALEDGPLLVRLLNLNGLSHLYLWAKEGAISGKVEFSRFTSLGDKAYEAKVGEGGRPNADPSELKRELTQKWLDGELEGKSKEDQIPFVEDLCRLLKAYRRQVGSYHPSWVTFWRDFEQYAAGGPDRWSRLVGVDHGCSKDQWVLLLVYTPDPDATFARPTQLDAGIYYRHYPSPATFAGGHPMDLDTASPPGSLLVELIHTQIDHSENQFVAGDASIAMTIEKIDLKTLRFERFCHHAILCEKYPGEVICPD